MFNQASIIGNLGADPELRWTSAGQAVCDLRIAVSERYGDKETTTWFRVTAWGKLAEVCKEHLHKGSKVFCQGPIRTQEWEDNDGNKRQSWGLMAREVKFLTPKSSGSAGKSKPSAEPTPDFGSDDIPF